MNSKNRVLSGIRATGRLHVGNYFGMVKSMVELQNDSNYEPYFMVADLHAMTTPFSPQGLKENRRDVVLDYLSAGLDPEKSVLFVQSDVREHVELAYYFSTLVTIARLSHLPTFKEKVKQYPENSTIALLYYPVLMASDILLYKTNSLPVGDDQLPHLEIAREIARKMNDQYGTNFPEPNQMKSNGQYVPSLTGEGKMSKSIEGSYISLNDSLESIKSKVAKIPTDSGVGYIGKSPVDTDGDSMQSSKEDLASRNIEKTYFDKTTNKPSHGVKSLMELIELFEGEEKRKQLDSDYEKGLRYKYLKDELSEAIFDRLLPMQEKRRELESNADYLDTVLTEGAEKARSVARETVKEVREKMGI